MALQDLPHTLRRLRDNWADTEPSDEAYAQAVHLASQVEFYVSKNRLNEAREGLEKLHKLSQKNAQLHTKYHWLHAKICFRERALKKGTHHLYLSMMAPYGTVRMRLKKP